jgi:hypothetical protein
LLAKIFEDLKPFMTRLRLSTVLMDTSGEPSMDLDHILLIILSRHSLPVLFKVGAQGGKNNTSAMLKYTYH